MLMVVWFWSVAAAMMPSAASFGAVPSNFTEMQTRTIEFLAPMMASATPVALPQIMTLGWVEEDDAPIF